MRSARKKKRPPAGLGFNFTPLIDVIFTLTIFYMLVSRFSSAEQVPMQLPRPDASLARVAKLHERVVINCRTQDVSQPDKGGTLYSIGPNNPEPLPVISDRLAAIKEQSPGAKVVIRADRRTPYADVRAVMRIVAQHGIHMMNVAAIAGEEER